MSEAANAVAPLFEVADVEELVENGSHVIVVGQGMTGALGVCPETIARLKAAGVSCRAAKTDRAVELYNELVSEGAFVGGLFHTTC